MKSSQMGVRRNFEKFQDRGSWDPMILNGYIESYLSLWYRMFQYRRHGEYDASKGVNVEDTKVRHGTTGWIDYL